LESEDPPLQTQIEFSASGASDDSTGEIQPVTESGEDLL
jgi:hypothetical protein